METKDILFVTGFVLVLTVVVTLATINVTGNTIRKPYGTNSYLTTTGGVLKTLNGCQTKASDLPIIYSRDNTTDSANNVTAQSVSCDQICQREGKICTLAHISTELESPYESKSKIADCSTAYVPPGGVGTRVTSLQVQCNCC
ncbi:hypothetical protein HZB00_02140 [Candidatus Woesearchaeota archaeon]|nr:hypothetical protein [Candidatus Woesearchaeota archaeon]